MRTVTVAVAAELAQADTQPAYLVAITFDSGVARFCTRGTVTWAGQSWAGAGLTVSVPTDSQPSGSLEFVDPDAAIHALIFTGAFKARAVEIYALAGTALADADPIHVASCVTTDAQSAQGRRTIGLARQRATLLQCPRQIIGPAIGCTFMAAPGEEIAWGGRILKLEPGNG